MSGMPEITVVAEIGCNHMGDFGKAMEMIDAARDAGADVVKFQKRNPRECLSEERYFEPYNSEHSFGETYGLHREALEFTLEQHSELMDKAMDLGMGYASSVWDKTSCRQIASLNPKWLKIPSAHNEDMELLEYVARNWAGPVHISNGMCGPRAEAEFLSVFGGSCVPYACTSNYPASMEDVCLLDIPRLLKLREINHRDGKVGFFCGNGPVGFSGHHNGIALDIAAAALGATYIERHFTLDRTWKGTDQAASLEPDGLRKLCRDLKAVQAAWKARDGILPCEEAARKKLKKITSHTVNYKL